MITYRWRHAQYYLRPKSECARGLDIVTLYLVNYHGDDQGLIVLQRSRLPIQP